MSSFNFNSMNLDNLLSPKFYRDVAAGLTSQAGDLRSRYKTFQETYREPHHTFFGSLFGKTTARTRTAFPPGYQQAMNDATSFENQAAYYKALADYIDANPVQDAELTPEQIAAMDPNGPDVNRQSLTVDVPSSAEGSPTVNSFGLAGLRIPYGT